MDSSGADDSLAVLATVLQMVTSSMQQCMEMWAQVLTVIGEQEDLIEDDEDLGQSVQQMEREMSTALSCYGSLRARTAPYIAHLHLRCSSRRPRAFPTSTEWWDSFVLGVWDNQRWLANFCMTRATFFEIADILRPQLQRQTTIMRRPVTVEKRLAVALWFLANTSSYREVSQLFGLGITTTAEIVVEVCLSMEMLLLEKTVCLGDHRKIMDGFEAMGMPHTIGAVYGTHIPLANYRGRQRQFSDRGRCSSILLQGVTDHTLRFIDVEIRWSGKNQDAYTDVFRNSAIFGAMDKGIFVPCNPTITVSGVQVPPLILGDGRYPMDRWLMNAYAGHLSPEETHFNTAFEKCYSVVERAFDHLKTRWKCLSGRLWLAVENVVPVISACVVLHNICEDKGHPLPPEDASRHCPRHRLVPDTQVASEVAGTAVDKASQDEGKRVRDALATHMYAHRA